MKCVIVCTAGTWRLHTPKRIVVIVVIVVGMQHRRGRPRRQHVHGHQPVAMFRPQVPELQVGTFPKKEIFFREGWRPQEAYFMKTSFRVAVDDEGHHVGPKGILELLLPPTVVVEVLHWHRNVVTGMIQYWLRLPTIQAQLCGDCVC